MQPHGLDQKVWLQPEPLNQYSFPEAIKQPIFINQTGNIDQIIKKSYQHDLRLEVIFSQEVIA